MLQVDVLTAYAICAAGALVGALIMRLVDSPQPQVRRAIELCTLGFVVLGLSLGSVFWAEHAASLSVQGLLAGGTVLSLTLFSAGLTLLAGQPAPGRLQMGLLLGLAVLVTFIPSLWGTTAASRVLVVAMVITSTMMVVNTRGLILRPRDGAERALSLAVVSLAGSSWLRAWLAAVAPGEAPAHLLHLPPSLVSPFAMLYGILPILVATLLLSLVNSRLRNDLKQRASIDELTGALTRRALREAVPAMLHEDAQRHGAVALLMLDIDHFKDVNDRFGHASGDLVLQQAGKLLREQLRADALLARVGGEEFVVLVPVSDLRGARLVAERLREAVATTPWLAVDGRPMGVTLSVGVTLIGPREPFDAALRRTDEALYRAKGEGRNQVQVALEAAGRLA
jgi:diguanylate cyclase (GGDEF)-like protein